MRDKIKQYLRDHDGTAGSEELAVHVLKLSNTPQVLADQLVASLVKDSHSIYKNTNNQWQLRENSEQEKQPVEMVLFVALPEKVRHWSEWQGFGYAEISKGKIQTFSFTKNLTAELSTFLKTHSQTPFFFQGFGNQKSQLGRFSIEMLGKSLEDPSFSIRQFVQRLFPAEEINSVELMCSLLGLTSFKEPDLSTLMNSLEEQAERVLEELEIAKVSSLEEMSQFYNGEIIDVKFANYAFDELFLQSLPVSPGVYVMKDKNKNIIYIGKSKNLHQRVNSYFMKAIKLDPKLERIRQELFDIEIIQTGSELEALLLEQELIEAKNPPINTITKVHERTHKQKQRFDQIVLLPAVKEDFFKLYFLSPQNGLFEVEVDSNKINGKYLGAKINRFWGAEEPINKKQYEIATSWLSQNDELVSTIDLRKFSQTTEIVNIIKNQLDNLKNEYEKIVQYA